MRKIITIVVTIAITTMSYAQDSTILRAKAQQSCTRDDGFKDWYCIDFKYSYEEGEFDQFTIYEHNK